MAIFKCKMCGGALEPSADQTTLTCEYCGTAQTLPRLDDDRRVNLYDRANHFRRNNEFDKAATIYENILSEDGTDAEAYWSLVLCRYGIEYVKDPSTQKRVPTVNRAQFTSVFDDDNYRSALTYASEEQRVIYEAEADAINEIQKGILSISQKEEPFDVFICYKETDKDGRRTHDSVLAQELYHQLKGEGFQVFFSRITLENKLGEAYEPYIFAALHSAKVMVVIGTDPEHLQSVWVKNEWSRYLSLVQQSGGKKVLIPAYRDMDPYDLPEEFSHLQAQDMSKLGFMQDLVRGIKKLIGGVNPQPISDGAPSVSSVAGIAPLLKRAFMYLSDGDWVHADEYCEKVLDQDPENAEAYLGKLMAERHCCRSQELEQCKDPIDSSSAYQKAYVFGDETLKFQLNGYAQAIRTRWEEDTYSEAVAKMKQCEGEKEYSEVATVFAKLGDYQDSRENRKFCEKRVEECRARKNKLKKGGIGFLIGSVILAAFIAMGVWIYNHPVAYQDAIDLMNQQEYEKAQYRFASLGDYKASQYYADLCKKEHQYQQVLRAMEQGAYDEAYDLLNFNGILKDYKDSKQLEVECQRGIWYLDARKAMEQGDYGSAMEKFAWIQGFQDANELLFLCGIRQIQNAPVGDRVYFGSYEQDNDFDNGAEPIRWSIALREGNCVLIACENVLDAKAFDTEGSSEWKDSSLYGWLNDAFLQTAFTTDEQACLAENPYGAWVSLLTSDQLQTKYKIATQYAKAQGVTTVSSDDSAPYWIMNEDPGIAASWIIDRGERMTKAAGDLSGVVPAIWINLDAVNNLE